MTKQDIVNMIDCEIEAENNNYRKYIKNNPDDKQREHDHAVIMDVYIGILHDLNMLFND